MVGKVDDLKIYILERVINEINKNKLINVDLKRLRKEVNTFVVKHQNLDLEVIFEQFIAQIYLPNCLNTEQQSRIPATQRARASTPNNIIIKKKWKGHRRSMSISPRMILNG